MSSNQQNSQFLDLKRVNKGQGNLYIGEMLGRKRDFIGIQIVKQPTKKVYSGRFHNDLPHFYGQLTTNQVGYVGELNAGVMSGVGERLNLVDNSYYIGALKNEVENGFGIRAEISEEKSPQAGQGGLGESNTETQASIGAPPRLADAKKLEIGYFVNGFLNGLGFIDQHGFKYWGQTQEGESHGVGSLIHQSDAPIEIIGTFKKGKLDGFSFQKTTSLTFVGSICDKVKQGFGYLRQGKKEYEGTFLKDKYSGVGFLLDKKKKSFFKGHFKNGKKSGFGRNDQENSLYIGGYKANKRDGIGLLLDKTKKVVQFGEWKKDKLNGVAIELGAGYIYKGRFKEGEKAGTAVLTKRDQAYLDQRFEGKRFFKSLEVRKMLTKLSKLDMRAYLGTSKGLLEKIDEEIREQREVLLQNLERYEEEYGLHVRSRTQADVGSINQSIEQIGELKEKVKDDFETLCNSIKIHDKSSGKLSDLFDNFQVKYEPFEPRINFKGLDAVNKRVQLSAAAKEMPTGSLEKISLFSSQRGDDDTENPISEIGGEDVGLGADSVFGDSSYDPQVSHMKNQGSKLLISTRDETGRRGEGGFNQPEVIQLRPKNFEAQRTDKLKGKRVLLEARQKMLEAKLKNERLKKSTEATKAEIARLEEKKEAIAQIGTVREKLKTSCKDNFDVLCALEKVLIVKDVSLLELKASEAAIAENLASKAGELEGVKSELDEVKGKHGAGGGIPADELEGRIEDQKNKKKDMESEIQFIEVELVGEKEKQNDALMRLLELMETNEDLGNQIESLGGQNESRNQKKAKIRKQLDNLIQEEEDIASEITKLTGNRDQAKNDLETKQNEQDTKNEEIQKIAEENNKKKQKVEEYEQLITQKEQEAAEVSNRLEKVNQDLEQKKQFIAAETDRLANLTAEKEGALADIQTQAEAVQEKMGSLEDSKRERAEAKQKERDEQNQQLEDLLSQKQEKTDLIAELEANAPNKEQQEAEGQAEVEAAEKINQADQDTNNLLQQIEDSKQRRENIKNSLEAELAKQAELQQSLESKQSEVQEKAEEDQEEIQELEDYIAEKNRHLEDIKQKFEKESSRVSTIFKKQSKRKDKKFNVKLKRFENYLNKLRNRNLKLRKWVETKKQKMGDKKAENAEEAKNEVAEKRRQQEEELSQLRESIAGLKAQIDELRKKVDSKAEVLKEEQGGIEDLNNEARSQKLKDLEDELERKIRHQERMIEKTRSLQRFVKERNEEKATLDALRDKNAKKKSKKKKLKEKIKKLKKSNKEEEAREKEKKKKKRRHKKNQSLDIDDSYALAEELGASGNIEESAPPVNVEPMQEMEVVEAQDEIKPQPKLVIEEVNAEDGGNFEQIGQGGFGEPEPPKEEVAQVEEPVRTRGRHRTRARARGSVGDIDLTGLKFEGQGGPSQGNNQLGDGGLAADAEKQEDYAIRSRSRAKRIELDGANQRKQPQRAPQRKPQAAVHKPQQNAQPRKSVSHHKDKGFFGEAMDFLNSSLKVDIVAKDKNGKEEIDIELKNGEGKSKGGHKKSGGLLSGWF